MGSETIIPNAGLRGLYELLSRLRVPDDPTPRVRSLGLQLAWADAAHRDGTVVVSLEGGCSVRSGTRPPPT